MNKKHSTIEQPDGNLDIDSDLRVNDLFKIDGEQAQLGVPHSEIQVELV